jgi:hypothetical protein
MKPPSPTVLAALVVATSCLLCGCETDLQGDKAPGELGGGAFRYDCFGTTDLACSNGEVSFPQAVAVGARFSIAYEPEAGPVPRVVAGSSASLASLPGGFEMKRAGYAALLALNAEREGVDLRHVRGAHVAQLQVSADAGVGLSQLRLQAGESHVLRAIPLDRFGVKLGGALSYRWWSSDEAVLQLQSTEDSNRALVVAGEAGQALLSVQVGKQAAFELEVTVEAAANAVEDGAEREGSGLSQDGGQR